MDPVTLHVNIDRPREEVFAYLADVANHPEFTDHFLKSWRLTREESAGRGAGARYKQDGRFDRFGNGKRLARYCGLSPRNQSSGELQSQGGLIDEADRYLRSTLIELAWRLLRLSPRWQALQAKGGRMQRLLWASTGVKDKAYDDTRYVVELAAPDTVNTMPAATLDALADHGRPRGNCAGVTERNQGDQRAVARDERQILSHAAGHRP